MADLSGVVPVVPVDVDPDGDLVVPADGDLVVPADAVLVAPVGAVGAARVGPGVTAATSRTCRRT